MVSIENPHLVLVHVSQVEERSVHVLTDIAAAKKCGVGLVMNTCPHEGVLVSLIRAGVTAFVLTRSDLSELLRAAKAAAHGRRHIDPVLNQRAIDILLRQQSQLSARERQVLNDLAFGFTNREISARLGVSTKTVETYRQRLREKLNLRSRPEIVKFALAMGLLRLDV